MKERSNGCVRNLAKNRSIQDRRRYEDGCARVLIVARAFCPPNRPNTFTQTFFVEPLACNRAADHTFFGSPPSKLLVEAEMCNYVLNRRFSSSRRFSRCASFPSIPPSFDFQV